MFLRWKRYENKDARWNGGVYWRAVLVESTRVDGKPRQKVVKYLGSVYRDGWSGTLFDEVQNKDAPNFYAVEFVVDFWRQSLATLREMKLTRTKRREVIEKLKDHVPVITRERITELGINDTACNGNHERYHSVEQWNELAKKLPSGKL